MSLLKSFLNNGPLFLLAGLVCLSGCAHINATPAAGGNRGDTSRVRIAVMPVSNLSGVAVPQQELRRAFIQELADRGVPVLGEEGLSKFMERHRVRYTAGLDGETGKAFKEEESVDGVLILSIDLYSTVDPPKIGLSGRLVSTGGDSKVLWAENRGAAGDDAPGILGIGLIHDPRELALKTVRSLAADLAKQLANSEGDTARPGARFSPRTSFRSPVLSREMRYRVAVVPFYNESTRKNAGEIMALQFLGALARCRNFEVIDPGVVRQRLLQFRIIMDQGVSVADADVLFQSADVDLILGGTVYDYNDIRGSYGAPKVVFSAQMLEKKSRETVWSSDSFNRGNDGVFFFNVGRINTADAMAKQMAQQIVDQMTEK